MSLTTVSKSMLRYIDGLNISETKRKCILKLCDKQIPKAIQKDKYNIDICPVCKERVKAEDKYCKNCGQHIIIESKDNKKLMMDFIDNDTIGSFKANSSIGEVDIFIKWGYMRVRKETTSLTFNINDKEIFEERDNDILLVADREICKGIIIYKPLEKLEFNPDEIVSFDGWEQVREFDPKIENEV